MDQIKDAQVIEAAIKKAGTVKHIVKLSAKGVGDEPSGFALGDMHVAMDKMVKELGATWTIIKPNTFNQNIANYFGKTIKAGGNITSAFGMESLAYVDTRDVGAVCAECLYRVDEFSGKTLEVNGPQNITHTEIAATIAKVIGKNVEYVDLA